MVEYTDAQITVLQDVLRAVLDENVTAKIATVHKQEFLGGRANNKLAPKTGNDIMPVDKRFAPVNGYSESFNARNAQSISMSNGILARELGANGKRVIRTPNGEAEFDEYDADFYRLWNFMTLRADNRDNMIHNVLNSKDVFRNDSLQEIVDDYKKGGKEKYAKNNSYKFNKAKEKMEQLGITKTERLDALIAKKKLQHQND